MTTVGHGGTYPTMAAGRPVGGITAVEASLRTPPVGNVQAATVELWFASFLSLWAAG